MLFSHRDKEVDQQEPPGRTALVTGNCHNRAKTFEDERHCLLFLQSIRGLKEARPFKLITYVLMPEDWWWPEDVKKLSIAMAEWGNEILEETRRAGRKRQAKCQRG